MVGPDLPGCQGELLGVGLDTGTPTVLVPVTGRPFSLGEYAGRCAAVVQAFMPGVEGAGAVARVLSSGVNPSGRLPVVIPCPRGGQPGSYLTDPCAGVVHPLNQLVGFVKSDLVAESPRGSRSPCTRTGSPPQDGTSCASSNRERCSSAPGTPRRRGLSRWRWRSWGRGAPSRRGGC